MSDAVELGPGLRQDLRPLRFDLQPPPGGYAWWYVDALSDDGRHGLVLIMFLGSVFSPSYARARRARSGAGAVAPNPLEHCAVNLIVYPLDAEVERETGKLWCFNEGGALTQAADQLVIGATSMAWDDARELLTVELDEPRTRFFGRAGPRVRGRLRLRPSAIFSPRVDLDSWRDDPRHRWYPIAPRARVELELDEPALRFSGSGYHDVNEGDEALERGFRSWTWSRCELERGAMIAYDVVEPGGQAHAHAWRFALEDPRSGPRPHPRITALAETERGVLTGIGRTRWGVERSLRADPERPPRLVRTLEDTPFYTRSVAALELDGQPTRAVHESVNLRRYDARWVQFLLPFKINEKTRERAP